MQLKTCLQGILNTSILQTPKQVVQHIVAPMFLSTKDQHNTFEIPTPTMTSISLTGVAQSFLLVPTNLIQYAAVISSLDLVLIRVQNQISVLKYINLNALCFVYLPTVNNEHRAESHSSMAEWTVICFVVVVSV